MRAKEYLQAIRSVKHRLEVADKEIEQARQNAYSLQCVNYSKDKVDGGEHVDLSNKIAQAEKIIEKIEKRRTRLIEIREEARERINALPDIDAQALLIEYCIIVKPLWKIQKEAVLSRSGFNKRMKKAVNCFNNEYGDWLVDVELWD